MAVQLNRYAETPKRYRWKFGTVPVKDAFLVGVGQETLLVTNSAPVTPEQVPSGATVFVLVVNVGSVRYTDSAGTITPGNGTVTNGSGELWTAGQSFSRRVDPRLINLIADTSTNAQVTLSYYTDKV